MVVIREADAISYLDRVDNTIAEAKKENHFFMPMPVRLTHTMISIQRAYISALMEDPATRSMAAITITPTGFPELPSWLGDTNRAFTEFDGSRKRRSEAYLPLLANVGSRKDIEQEIGKISRIVASDKILTDMLGNAESKAETEYIKGWANKSVALPVSQDDNLGMLVFNYDEQNNRRYSAIKYVDNLGGSPLFYYTRADVNDSVNHTSGTITGGTSGFEAFLAMSYPLRALLLSGDYTLTGVDRFETLYAEMLAYHRVLGSLKETSNMLLAGKGLNPIQYAEEIREINYRLNSLTEDASNEELKLAFRQSLGNDVNSLRWTAQRISGESTAVVPKKRSKLSRFLGRLPRLRIEFPK